VTSGSHGVSRQPGSSYLQAPDVAMVEPAVNVDLRPFGSAMRTFGQALGSALKSQANHGNLVYSPLSLALALALVREGARGKTAAQLDKVLHLSANRGAMFDSLIRSLRADDSDGNTVGVADRAFAAPGFALRPSYLTALKKWYDAGVYRTPFPSPGLQKINSYVDRQTHGRIPHLLQGLSSDTLMVLVNAVYLRARWAVPFESGLTTDSPFTTATGDRVTVKMMGGTETLDYASGPGWQAVRLPYRGGRLSMWILLPAASTTPLHLLSSRVLDQAAQGFAPTEVGLTLPRWEAESRLDLKDPLDQLGLTSLMSAPNLAGMTSTPGLQVSQALQQADIAVGEKGTVAAAATGLAIAGSATLVPHTVDVDHPFAYAIMDDHTGMPLFEGIESDPSQGGHQ
jgi:serpin B